MKINDIPSWVVYSLVLAATSFFCYKKGDFDGMEKYKELYDKHRRGYHHSESESIDALIGNNPIFSRVKIYGQEFNIPFADLTGYRRRSHEVTDSHYLNFVTPRDPTIKRIAPIFRKESDEATARAIVKYVHNAISVAPESESKIFIRFPLETIADGLGVCDEKSTTAASFLAANDIGCALLVYDLPEPQDDHMAIGIEGNFTGKFFTVQGRRFYYAETTSNRVIGEQPDFVKGIDPIIHIVK